MARRSRGSGTVFRPTVTSIRNGRRVKRKSKFYWARLPGEKPFALRLPTGGNVTDQAVALSELNKALNRRERKAAGLVDAAIESAGLPMRFVLANYVRHLRGRRLSKGHIEQSLQVGKWLIDNGPMARLADFNESTIEKALNRLADTKRSPRTVNVYRRVCHSLADWAIRFPKWMQRNPVADVSRRDESCDIRKERRALTVDEAGRLLNVAGPRRLFYAFQLWTGLRVGETEALEWRDLDLDGERPAIALRAATTKAKRADVIPLHPDLAKLLRDAKPTFASPTDRLFDRAPRLRTFCGGFVGKGDERRYIKGDLDRAGIPRVDSQERSIDRHALRTTFISWLGLYGVDPRAQTRLARHSPVGVTFRHYMDYSLLDLWSEIRKLPTIPGKQTQSESVVLQATGTDNARPDPVVLPVVLMTGKERVSMAGSGSMADDDDNAPQVENKRENKGKNRIGESEKAFGATGFEPATSCSQSRRATGLRHAPLRAIAYPLSLSRTTPQRWNVLFSRDCAANAAPGDAIPPSPQRS